MKRWNEKYHDKFKRHSLSGQLLDLKNLREAWEKVRANKGCAGIDGESVGQFEAQRERNLREIQRLLRQDRYQFQPVRRVYIPKADGKQRSLGIPTVRDRIVQQAVKSLLEPIFEEIFLPCSHGYRPNKNAHQAIEKAEAYLEHGYHWVVDADIQGFFDHVDHQICLDLVREKIADGRILDLITAMLQSGVMKEGKIEETVEGTPQGGVISPLLANIYLNHFDRRMGENGYLLIRYADDLLIFCKTESEAQRVLQTATETMEQELRLTLNPEKTRIVMARKKGVEFLGFRFNGRWRRPKDKAVDKFREAIRYRTRRAQPKNVQNVIELINPIIEGWGRYFCKGTPKTIFRILDSWIRGRIRCFKAKKRTKKVILYTLPKTALERMGLVSLESLISRNPIP